MRVEDEPYQLGLALGGPDRAGAPAVVADLRALVERWTREGAGPEQLAARVADLLAQEREACAAIVDDFGARNPLWSPATEQIAAAIRARGRTVREPTPAEAAISLVRAFLKLNPGTYFCDRCLGYELKLSPQRVRESITKLAGQPEFALGVYWCRRCSEHGPVIACPGKAATPGA